LWIKAGKPKAGLARDNELLDIFLEIMSNISLRESVHTPATMDDIKALAREISELRGDVSTTFLYNAPDGMYAAWKNGSVGKKNIATTAVANLTNAFLSKNDVKLKPAYHVQFNGEVYEGWDRDKDSTRRIADYISSVLTSATDNEKNPTHGILNWTFNTLPLYNLLISLGVPLKTVGYFSNQPMIIRYANKIDNFNSAINIPGFNDKSSFYIRIFYRSR